MANFIQVVDGKAVNFSDILPPDPIGTNGWKNAVENIPPIIQGRQTLSELNFF